MRVSLQRRKPTKPFTRKYSSPWGTGTKFIQSIDCHAAGEPARVLVNGVPHIQVLQEPRGYPCQNANVIVPAVSPEAQFGFIILEQNKIYPLMSGHNTICVATALLETGMIKMKPKTEFILEAPGGLIPIIADCKNGKVTNVTLKNVPSFVAHSDVIVDVPQIGKVSLDVVFGGMWYANVKIKQLGIQITPKNGKQLVRLGEMIKVATREQFPVNHPEFDYPGVDILVFTEPAQNGNCSKNTVVMSNNILDWNDPGTWTGMLDRSPCGTGTCAVMASLWNKGQLKIGEEFIHESIIGTKFIGKLIEETVVGPYKAVIPVISGQAWITQHAQIVLDPTDPFPEGYTVGDIWG